MTLRTDIQALRGIAVLLVILNHAGLGAFQAGYLGVDIFFVISGYLITGMVKRDIESGTFRFAAFYFRRAKRLLPAAYVVFLATALVAPFVLAGAEQRDLHHQLLGAVTFTANIALWAQSGYFDGAAGLKPLLHVWSLSIEEQYYLILPATMVLVPRRHWKVGALLVLTASAALCFTLLTIKPVATFYLLPTRAWELAIGSVAALGMFRGAWSRASVRWLFWPAVLALIVIPALPEGGPHPGWAALIVCAATLIVILRNHEGARSNPVVIQLARVGDYSYSLYLAHWPVFAFLNNAYVGKPSGLAHLAAVAAAFTFGALLYRLVESPVRRMELHPSRRLVAAVATASAALGIVPLVAASTLPPERNTAMARVVNEGFGPECESEGDFAPMRACQNSGRPKILVWGDSFAKHLVPGIVAVTDAGVSQATRNSCGPFLGLALTKSPRYARGWSEKCLRFNRSVIDHLRGAHSVEVVVMSSPIVQYVDPMSSALPWRLVIEGDGESEVREPSVSLALAAMGETIRAVRALGKRVVFFAPPPSAGIDIGRCLDRRSSGKLNLGPAGDCRIPVADFERHQRQVLAFLRRLAVEADVRVVRFDHALCGGTSCATELNGTPLYRDAGHLSHDGSRLLAKRMNWASLLKVSGRRGD